MFVYVCTVQYILQDSSAVEFIFLFHMVYTFGMFGYQTTNII